VVDLQVVEIRMSRESIRIIEASMSRYASPSRQVIAREALVDDIRDARLDAGRGPASIIARRGLVLEIGGVKFVSVD
jgi:hypothetical protein